MTAEHKVTDRRKAMFLEMIAALAKENYNPPGLLRTLLTCWFAHDSGGPFFTKMGNPRWLNTKDIKRLPLTAFHAVSVDALQEISAKGLTGRGLVLDHGTPIEQIWIMIRGKSATAIVKILRKHLKLVVVTREQHNGPLARETGSIFEDRYGSAGIDLATPSDVAEMAAAIAIPRNRRSKKKVIRKTRGAS